MGDRIKVIKAALDEFNGDIVLRGVIDPNSLRGLRVDEYQREIISQKKIDDLVRALKGKGVPDVELGMRGENFQERGDAFYLIDPVYIVDGLQRITAATQLMERDRAAQPRIGATIHFGTTEDWERDRFDALNIGQTKLSSNVTLRNLRHKLEVADVLYALATTDRKFVMREKITWTQSARVGELMSAIAFYKIVGRLHAHIGPGLSNSTLDLPPGLQKILENAGRNVFQDNIRAFFDVLDVCWGIRVIAYKETAVHIKQPFLFALAKLFREHLDYWEGDRLVVPEKHLKRLKGFSMTDPTVRGLAGSNGMASDLLFSMLVEHINSGRGYPNLKRRSYSEPVMMEAEIEGEGNDA